MLPQWALTLFRLGFLENFYDWEERRGGKCPSSLFAYISTISSAKSVIHSCIENKFYTLSVETLKRCNKILFWIKKVNF